MLAIVSITAPIFLLIGVGYFAVATRLIAKPQIQGLGAFVINFALPALIIRALIQRPVEETFNGYYLLGYGLASVIVFAAALTFALRIRRKPLDVASLYALGMSGANSGFVGYPVAALVVGSPAVIAMALNMVIENLLIIPLALALAEAGSQGGASFGAAMRQSVSRLSRNPIIIAILLGMAIAILDVSLPAPLFKAVDMLATAAAPTALFVIGGTLYGLRTRGMRKDVSQIAFGKLVVHPLAVLLVFLALPDFDPALAVAAVVFASAPMLSVYPIFGQRYGHPELCTAALMGTTLVSFITISAVIWIVTFFELFGFAG
ncbi:AEC family transporter [Modicisalibacter luteus]|uniref:AEC family transporter n=1 Tax=Modicisalibacter luteus TaxID=453962 RepID=A0ABV7M5U3_9GAMM|nr:AEC family transporter [Halomonas lutea]GHB15005.1 malonate transporter [Halomonas lutea]